MWLNNRVGLSSYLMTAVATLCAVIGWSAPSEAFVQKFVIDQTNTANYSPIPLGSSVPGPAASYTIYTGRIFGQLDPNLPQNSVIEDIGHAAPITVGGTNYSYISQFSIVTPTNPAERSGVLIYEVSNRGGSAISTGAMIQGATYIQSGWQGDLLSLCSGVGAQLPVSSYPCVSLSSAYGTTSASYPFFAPPAGLTDFVIQVPVATTDAKAPGSSNVITGPVYGHIKTPVGANQYTAQMVIYGSAWVPFQPADINDTTTAQFWYDASQTTYGADTGKTFLTSNQWSWAYCPNGPTGAGYTPNPYWICLNNGGTFNQNYLYEMSYTAANPLVQGVGWAATRDFVSFLRFGTTAPGGGSNPIAGTTTKALAIGVSQSGSFLHGLISYGFNQDESNRQIFEGQWVIISGKVLWMMPRWSQPNIIGNLYMGGYEAPTWWADFPNQGRGLPPGSMLDKCNATKTCPQVLETWGGNEFYIGKMAPSIVGNCTNCIGDIPQPANVYRYYVPGASHGGGTVNFNWVSPSSLASPFSTGAQYPTSPIPETYTNNALQYAFIQLLTNGTPMPPSAAGLTYPSLSKGQLAPALIQASVGFPSGVPGLPYGGNSAWPPFLYNFGPNYDYKTQSGIPTIEPPTIANIVPGQCPTGACTAWVPTTDADGNDNGGGIPTVLFQAPLATYMDWNIIPSNGLSPYAGQGVQLNGGYYPFWDTKANRTTAGDPRLSLEERYGSHTGYNCVVRQAANKAVEQRFLLTSDATTLTTMASAGNVLASLTPTTADQGVANVKCEFTTTHGFTSSAHSDILWRDIFGDVAIWSMNGATISAATLVGNLPNNWTVAGQHDFNGDGSADVLWRDTAGDVGIWLMNGTKVTEAAVIANVPTDWRIVGTGDFNGDGKSDILWRDSGGDIAITLMNGTTIISSAIVGTVPTTWTIAGTGDFNGDGMTDILWRDTSGNVGISLMNGTTVTSTTVVGNIPTNWVIVGTGDFNSDGKSDVLWRDGTGDVAITLMNGATISTTAVVGQVPNSWSIAETGDFNGDGMSDILLRDHFGNVGVWLMNGTTVSKAASIGSAPTFWAIQTANAD
jgi:hypothetical protein